MNNVHQIAPAANASEIRTRMLIAKTKKVMGEMELAGHHNIDDHLEELEDRLTATLNQFMEGKL